MKIKTFTLITVLFLLVLSCNQFPLSPADKVLFEEDFNIYPDNSRLPVGWWYEGSQMVRIEKGRLRADANPDNTGEDYEGCTVWLEKTFKGDIRIEFDAHVLASEGDKNNINFFFLFSDPSGESLYDTRLTRADGKYGRYHELNGYVFTFLADGNPQRARFRMRDDPGFHLLQENYAYECKRGRTYHICITKKGRRITYEVDGVVYLDQVDDKLNPEHEAGIIGFRTWRTDLWWDNLKVVKLD